MDMDRNTEKWLRLNRDAHSVQRLSEIIPFPKVDFKVGDKVAYTNPYGFTFHNFTVIDINKNNSLWKYGNYCIYLDKDSYWHPVKPEELELENEE